MNTIPRLNLFDAMGQRPRAVILPAALVLVVGSALILPATPLVVVPLVAVLGGLVLATLGRAIERIFFTALGGLLLGYLFQDKSFAYFGAPPLYVGELVLGLGLYLVAFGRIYLRISLLQVAILAFIVLGALRTYPYIEIYHMDALRDAALWYYAAFALLVSLFLTEAQLRTTVRWAAKIFPWLLLWFTVAPVLFRVLPPLPPYPGSPLPIFSLMKPGDRGVVLAGLGAFALTGLYERLTPRGRLPAPLLWACWLFSALMVSAWNRGGMISMAVSLMVLFLLQPSRAWLKPAVVITVIMAALLIVNPTIDTGGYRKASITQLAANVTSIFSNDTSDQGAVESTKEWRLQWWKDIYNDTFHGPLFWTGNGFGVNLATEYGFRTESNDPKAAPPLRSPHSSHMTVLARMGVPGLVLWVIIHLTFANLMVRAYREARRRDDMVWASVIATVLVWWFAGIVNSSFDVYLEGPQGAIPFWCLIGTGLAVMRLQHERYAQQDAAGLSAGGAMHAHPAYP